MLSSFSQKGMIEGEHMQEWFDSVGKKFVLAFVEGDRWKLYFKGLGVTLEIALFAAILGMVIGTVVALMRLSQKRNGKRRSGRGSPVSMWMLSGEPRQYYSF